jgi:hypothetical protein
MKQIILAVLLGHVAAPVIPEPVYETSASSIVIAAADPRTVAVVLSLPAEFVSVPLNVVSDQRDSAFAYEELRQALEFVTQKATENHQFRVESSVIALSQRKGGLLSSSSSWNPPAASAQVYLLVPLTKERDNLFAAGAEAARFVGSLRLPGKARCEFGKLQLAIQNPEKHRAKLLGMLAADVAKTRSGVAASDGGVKLEGLESPVMVRQVDDRNVELYLNYSLAITAGK